MFNGKALRTIFLLVFFIWLLLYSKNNVFLWVTSAIVILAGVEWLKLLNFDKNYPLFIILTLSYLAIILSFVFIELKIYPFSKIQSYNHYYYAQVFWATISFLCLAFIGIISCRIESLEKFNLDHPKLWQFIGCMSNILFLFPAWLSCNYLKQNNDSAHMLIIVLLYLIIKDITVYIFSKFFDKSKPIINSPYATYYGLLVGCLSTGFFITLILFVSGGPAKGSDLLSETLWLLNRVFMIMFSKEIIYIVPLSLLVALISTPFYILALTGDLMVNLFKRVAEAKNASKPLPGYIGIFDRIYGFCAIAPLAGLWVNF